MRDLEALKAAQLEDARGRWYRIGVWMRRWTKRLKDIAAFATVVGTIAGLGIKVWHFMKAREASPAELPATGEPTTAMDFVSKPAGDSKKP